MGQEDPLEEGMTTHASILAWRIPSAEEPGRLQFIGPQSQTQLKRLSAHTRIVSTETSSHFELSHFKLTQTQ